MEVLYSLKGNKSLLLDDPEKLWIVRTGQISLFATKLKERMPLGDRHYLFTVGAGEALFGGAANYEKSFGLLAVAIEATELSEISITDLAAQVAAGEASAIALLKGWVNRLNQTFSTEGTAINSRYLSLRMSEGGGRAVVLQNGRIGTGSIFENITAGALLSHDQALEAAQMAGLTDDITQMPMGIRG